MKESGILPSIALERINRGVITHVEMIDVNNLMIVSSSGTFIVSGDINECESVRLFFAETERPQMEWKT